MDNIPKKSGALIVYQHHLLPYDLLYVMSDIYYEHKRPPLGVMHRDMEMINPGLCKVVHKIFQKSAPIADRRYWIATLMLLSPSKFRSSISPLRKKFSLMN